MILDTVICSDETYIKVLGQNKTAQRADCGGHIIQCGYFCKAGNARIKRKMEMEKRKWTADTEKGESILKPGLKPKQKHSDNRELMRHHFSV